MALSDDDKLKLLYPAALTMLNQSEATTWARLGNFITVSGFMTGAFSLAEGGLRVFIATGGMVLSAFYLYVMIRSRAYVDRFVTAGLKLEKEIGHEVKILTEPKATGGLPSKYVAIGLPIGFLVFHGALLFHGVLWPHPPPAPTCCCR
jgi:hypothetical protein